MRLLLSLVTLVCIPSLLRVYADDLGPCTAESGGQFYDLSPLQSKTNYEVASEIGQRNITLNVCGPVTGEMWNINDPQNIAGYYRGPRSDVSIGQVNTTLSIAHGHPLLILSGGTECTIGQGEDATPAGIQRSTIVRFICDTAVFSKGTPKLVGQLPPDDDTACAFFIEWRTHVACPTSRPGRGTWGPVLVFFVIIFMTMAAYLTAAIFYNRIVLGLRGRESLPSFSLAWLNSVKSLLSCASLRKRGDTQSQPTWGRWQHGGQRGFSRLPTDEEEAMLDDDNRRFSLDEEQQNGPASYVSPSGPPLDR